MDNFKQPDPLEPPEELTPEELALIDWNDGDHHEDEDES